MSLERSGDNPAEERRAPLLSRFVARLNRSIGIGVVKTLFYNRTNAGACPSPLPLAPGVVITRLSPDQAHVWNECPGAGPKLAQARFENGDACYVAYLNGSLVHYSWVRRSGVQAIPEAGYDHTISPGEFWIYHCWTHGRARGQRIYPCVLMEIAAYEFRSGLATAWIYTTEDNIASQRGIQRAGFQPAFTRRAFRTGSRMWKIGSIDRQNQ